MAKKVDKSIPLGDRIEARRRGEGDKRRGFKISQEAIDFIAAGIAAMKNKSQISREVQAKYGMSYGGAYKRVQRIWDKIASAAGVDVNVERHRVSAALLEIYREARDSSDIELLFEQIDKRGLEPEHWWRLLNKWDPNKSRQIAMKALEQYTKLHGVDAPEKVEHKHEHDVNPLTMTPQEKQKRIAELLAKREIEIPTSDGIHGLAPERAKSEMN